MKPVDVLRSALAGIMIGIGCIALAKVENNYLAAFLFSVALLSIIRLQLPLYTGRIGDLAHSPSVSKIFNVIIILAFNMLGMFIVMLFSSVLRIDSSVLRICEAKATKDVLNLFVAGILCNVLIHVAAKAKNDCITIMCIATFILCGFEHSIADIFFLLPVDPCKWIVVLAGNTFGGIMTERLLNSNTTTEQIM